MRYLRPILKHGSLPSRAQRRRVSIDVAYLTEAWSSVMYVLSRFATAKAFQFWLGFRRPDSCLRLLYCGGVFTSSDVITFAGENLNEAHLVRDGLLFVM